MATVKLETFSPSPGSISSTLFEAKLRTAVSTSPDGTVIDCTTYRGNVNIGNTIEIIRAFTILLGNTTVTYSGKDNTNMFNIYGPNVKFIGVSRSTRNPTDGGSTVFRMSVNRKGYHMFVGYTSTDYAERFSWQTFGGFTLKNIDFVGMPSLMVNDEGYAAYITSGSGGIAILPGSPFNSCQTVDDVVLDNISILNSRYHGLFMMNCRNASLSNVEIINPSLSGLYMLQCQQSSVENCEVRNALQAGVCLDRSKNIKVDTSRVYVSGMGYWLKSSKACELVSCSSENGVARDTQPYDNAVILPIPMPFRLDDVSTPYIDMFKGTSFMISGVANLGNSVDLSYGSLPYGYTALNYTPAKRILVGEGLTDLECTDECPTGFKCENGRCVADISSGYWTLSGSKPSGGLIYNGPNGQPLHTGWTTAQNFQLDTGWGDAEDYSVYGNCEFKEGYIKINGLNFRQIITSDDISGVSCPGGDECPVGFSCVGGTCVPNIVSPTWTLIGNKPGGGGPVYVHTSGVQFHTGWDDREELVEKLYYTNNEDLTDYTSSDNSLISCTSIYPNHRADLVTYESEDTAHIMVYGSVNRTNIITPRIVGYATKFAVKVVPIGEDYVPDSTFINIPDPSVNTDDPEPVNFDYLRINDVLDQGLHTRYGMIE